MARRFHIASKTLGDLERIEGPQPKSLVLDVANSSISKKPTRLPLRHITLCLCGVGLSGIAIVAVQSFAFLHPCRAVLELRVFAAPVECISLDSSALSCIAVDSDFLTMDVPSVGQPRK